MKKKIKIIYLICKITFSLREKMWYCNSFIPSVVVAIWHKLTATGRHELYPNSTKKDLFQVDFRVDVDEINLVYDTFWSMLVVYKTAGLKNKMSIFKGILHKWLWVEWRGWLVQRTRSLIYRFLTFKLLMLGNDTPFSSFSPPKFMKKDGPALIQDIDVQTEVYS